MKTKVLKAILFVGLTLSSTITTVAEASTVTYYPQAGGYVASRGLDDKLVSQCLNTAYSNLNTRGFPGSITMYDVVNKLSRGEGITNPLIGKYVCTYTNDHRLGFALTGWRTFHVYEEAFRVKKENRKYLRTYAVPNLLHVVYKTQGKRVIVKCMGTFDELERECDGWKKKQDRSPQYKRGMSHQEWNDHKLNQWRKTHRNNIRYPEPVEIGCKDMFGILRGCKK